MYIHSLTGATSFLRPVEGVAGESLELFRHAGRSGLRREPALPPCRRCQRGTGGLLGASSGRCAPYRGLMGPLLAFLKDTLGWWRRMEFN